MVNLYKYIVIFIVLIGCNAQSWAQYTPMNLPTYDKKQWHFGFTLGVNSMNFIANPIDIEEQTDDYLVLEPIATSGFNIGIVANKRLAEYLDLRFIPTLSFGQRNLRYIFMENDTVEATYIKTVESTYLDFPFELKYKGMRLPGRANNIRPYVIAGARYSIDMSSQKDKKLNNGDIIIKLRRHDFMYEMGVGFDFYMKYFKFGTELKMAYGIMNNLHQENNKFTYNIDKLHSKILWITFTFE